MCVVDILVRISALWFAMLWWSQLEKCRVPHISRGCVYLYLLFNRVGSDGHDVSSSVHCVSTDDTLDFWS